MSNLELPKPATEVDPLDLPGIRIGSNWYWPELDYSLPYISGGDGDDGPDDDDDDDGDEDDPPENERKFTQKQVNRIAATEKKQGRQAAIRELSEELGVTLEEAKEIIRSAKERADEDKSEAQKAKDAADAAKAAADAAKRDAEEEKHASRVERYLLRAGVPEGSDEDEGKALARVARMLDVEVGADADDIKEAIDDLKKDFPALFKAGEDDEEPPSKGSRRETNDSTPPKPKGKGKLTPQETARQRLEARHKIASKN